MVEIESGVTGRELFQKPDRTAREVANVAIVELVFDGFAAGNFSALVAHMAPEGTSWILGFTPERLGSRIPDAAVIGALFADGMHFDIKAVAAEGDLVFVEWEDEAITSGGKRYENTGLSVFRFDDQSRIRSYHEYIDADNFVAVLE